MKKIWNKKSGFVLLFAGCLVLTLLLPGAVNRFWDDRMGGDISYPEENEEAVFAAAAQSGYSSAEIIMAVNNVIRESGGYDMEAYSFMESVEKQSDYEVSQASEDEKAQIDAEFTGEIRLENLFRQSAEDFTKIHPDVVQQLQKEARKHIKSGLYDRIPEVITRQAMNDTEYIYLYYENSDGSEVISTLLWMMLFVHEDGALQILVNPYDGSILALKFVDWIADDDLDLLVEKAYMQREKETLRTAEYFYLAENYGASSAKNEIDLGEEFSAENREITNIGEVRYCAFLGTLNFTGENGEEKVPFVNMLVGGSEIPKFAYGPAWCMEILNY